MGPRRAVRLPVAALAVALCVGAAGCGTEDPPRMPLACTQDTAAITRALAAAPGDVRLPDGSLLSTCVTAARTDGQLASLGLLLTGIAEDLGARARDERDPVLARRLGYLAGAVQRGSDRTNGLQAELARRVGRAAIKLEGAGQDLQDALVQGTRAGLARG